MSGVGVGGSYSVGGVYIHVYIYIYIYTLLDVYIYRGSYSIGESWKTDGFWFQNAMPWVLGDVAFQDVGFQNTIFRNPKP